MKFTIEISIGVKDGSTYSSIEIEDIDSDDLVSSLKEIEDSIISILDSKFLLEEEPND